jgi:hypothetical protein
MKNIYYFSNMLPDFKIEVEQKKTYWQRRRGWLPIMAFLFSVTIFILPLLFGHHPSPRPHPNWPPIILMFIYTLILFVGGTYFRDFLRAKNFITLFEIKDGNLYIQSIRKDKPKSVNGPIEDFSFIFLISNKFNRCYYIIVKHKTEGKILMQANNWNWKEPFAQLCE